MPFTLEDNEAAIVFSEDGMKIIMPKGEDENDLVPDHVKICVGLAALWQKEDTRPIIEQMIEDLYNSFLHQIKAEEDTSEEDKGEGC